MRVVVDTNVVAYHLLQSEPFWRECRAFWADVREAIAPTSWESELANVLWMAVRANVIDVSGAMLRLDHARMLGVRSIPVSSLWHGAVVRACVSGLAAYDALFVELAAREEVPLATFDSSILKAFPALAKRPAKLVRRTDH